MKGYGMTLLLRDDPDLIARYKQHHLAVWPAVTTRLRALGIDHMEIFLADRRMFMHFTAPDDFDPSRDFSSLVDDPEYQRWDELMRTFQEPAPGALPGEWWHTMEEASTSTGRAGGRKLQPSRPPRTTEGTTGDRRDGWRVVVTGGANGIGRTVELIVTAGGQWWPWMPTRRPGAG
jgi:L-rhamnose mutarotase